MHRPWHQQICVHSRRFGHAGGRRKALADSPYWGVFQCSIRPGLEREHQTCSVSSAIVLVLLLGLLSR